MQFLQIRLSDLRDSKSNMQMQAWEARGPNKLHQLDQTSKLISQFTWLFFIYSAGAGRGGPPELGGLKLHSYFA
jgi:hypothetical protein